jgi:hypothetical protein
VKRYRSPRNWPTTSGPSSISSATTILRGPQHYLCSTTRVPPTYYGGTERVVSYLTEELVRQGHEVTLFASGDSVTNARLVAPCPRALRLDPQCQDPLPPRS